MSAELRVNQTKNSVRDLGVMLQKLEHKVKNKKVYDFGKRMCFCFADGVITFKHFYKVMMADKNLKKHLLNFYDRRALVEIINLINAEYDPFY